MKRGLPFLRDLLVTFGPLAGAILFAVHCALPGTMPVAEHLALTGGHSDVTCADCHGTDLHAPLPDGCIGCHAEDAPPDHYEGDCGDCHTVASWEGADIDHSFFPLQQGHGGLQCTDCHAEDTFDGLSSSCQTCHESDRPRNHFSGDCNGCHNIADWEDADFDHRRFFPIPHEGVNDCASCHPDSSNYAIFSCTDCHEHRQSKMDNEHDDVRNYRWESSACLECHPDGNE